MEHPLAFIIEDDKNLANAFAKAFISAGYHTEVIHNGQEALEKLSQIIPNIILLDLHLPRVRGTVILQEIRADSRFNDTYVILASADTQAINNYKQDVDFVFIKPIRFRQLKDLAIKLHPNISSSP